MVTSSKVGVVPDGVDVREGVVLVSTRVGPRGRGEKVAGSREGVGVFLPKPSLVSLSLLVVRPTPFGNEVGAANVLKGVGESGGGVGLK